MKFGFIAKHRGIWPSAGWLCEALGVLSKSRGSAPKKPKYALLTGVSCGRRMGSGKGLAEVCTKAEIAMEYQLTTNPLCFVPANLPTKNRRIAAINGERQRSPR